MRIKKSSIQMLKLAGAVAASIGVVVLFFFILFVTDPVHNLVVRDVRFVGGGEERVIAGILENRTSGRVFTDINIQIDFYDETGKKVGDTEATRDVLEAGTFWQFAAPATEEGVASYEIFVYSPDTVRARWLGGCVIMSCYEGSVW